MGIYTNSKIAKGSKSARSRGVLRIQSLSARVNVREILAYVVGAILLAVVVVKGKTTLMSSQPIMLSRDGQYFPGVDVHSPSRVLPLTPRRKTPAFPVDRAGDALGVNLFASRVLMREGGKDAMIKAACEELANIVVSKYLSLRPQLIWELKNERGEGSQTQKQAGQDEVNVQGFYADEHGADLNDAFYSWQEDKRQGADKQYMDCVTTYMFAGASTYENELQKCAEELVQNEWPDVYNSTAYKTLANLAFETAAKYDGKAVERAENNVYSRSRSGLMHVWFSVHTPGMFHGEHNHANSSIAGTLYLQSNGESGRIVFVDPRSPPDLIAVPGTPGAQTMEASSQSASPKNKEKGSGTRSIIHESELFDYGRRGFSVKPQRGTMLLFPPWLFHQVERTKDSEKKKKKKKSEEEEKKGLSSHDQLDDLGQVKDRSSFRVAMSFNIGRSWETSVEYSLLDVFEPGVHQMLISDILAPTRRNDTHASDNGMDFDIVDDSDLRDTMISGSSFANIVVENFRNNEPSDDRHTLPWNHRRRRGQAVT